MIDIETVKSAKLGDPDSFAEIYDGIAPELYRVALYALGNPQDAEDVVSETFLEAYKGIKNLRDETRIKRWMMTILSVRIKRRIAGYIKARKTVDINELIDLPDEGHDRPSTEKVAVVEALTQVDETERLIVLLSVVQGYTAREISQMLDMPQGTVSSKLYRTLKKLRDILS